MFRRRSTRSATAPASGPSRSAGSRDASQTPLTAAVAVVALPPRLAASVDRASRLSQSPRLDRDVAIQSRRNGLMDSTLPFAVLVGGDRKFTALRVPIAGPQRRFPQCDCPGSQLYLPRGKRQPAPAGSSSRFVRVEAGTSSCARTAV